MTRCPRSLAAIFALALTLGCASAPKQPERSVLMGNPARNLLILPLNVAAAMPEELVAQSPIVWDELEIYLRGRDRQLKTVNPRDIRRLWIASVREVRARPEGAKAGYKEAARVLVGKLAQYAEFDGVIVPSLFIRKAQIHDQAASWDGVERPVELEASGAARTKLTMSDTMGDEKLDAKLEGVAPAASFHAVVFDAQGNEIQEAVGGIELLVSVEALARRSGAITFKYVTRTDLFSNLAWVRQGIALALAPFIPLQPD